MKKPNPNLSHLLALALLVILSVSFLPQTQAVRAVGPADRAAGPVPITTILRSEGFEESSFPPPGWATQAIGGSTEWQRTNDTGYPPGLGTHGGLWLAYFNSLTAPAGSAARLYTTQLDFTASRSYFISFWMLNDYSLPSAADEVQVEVDPGTGFVAVGAPILRYAPSRDWAQHIVDLTAYAGNMVRVSLKGISDFGYDIYIDDITIYATTPGYQLFLPLVKH